MISLMYLNAEIHYLWIIFSVIINSLSEARPHPSNADSWTVSLPKLLKFSQVHMNMCSSNPTTTNINIAEMIGVRYRQFGVLLLNDITGQRVENIEYRALNNPVEINILILQEWLKGAGMQPVTWGTLIQVLRDIGLNELARTISEGIQLVQESCFC